LNRWKTSQASDVPFTQFIRTLEAAVGYFELGMADEALRELDTLPPDDQHEEDVLEFRLLLNPHLGRWEAASHCCEALCRSQGADAERFITWATCLYELGEVAACKIALQQAPPSARTHALWNFHMASYEAILGRCDAAIAHIEAALAIDPATRSVIAQNTHLSPLLPMAEGGRATGT